MALPAGYEYNSEESYLMLTEAKNQFGVVEREKVFEEIFPTYTGIASIIGMADIYSFFDNSIDFDVRDCMISGLEPKIHFNTGNLAGYEFPIRRFDSGNSIFVIQKITDERGLEIPNSSTAFQISEGDEYKILDITLPDALVKGAEMRLFTEGKAYLDKFSVPTVLYEAEPDRLYFKNHPPTRESWFEVGDSIVMQDDVLIGGEETLRIVSFTRDVFEPEKYSFVFGNSAYRNAISKINKRAKSVENIIENTVYKDPVKRLSANIRVRSNDYDGGRI